MCGICGHIHSSSEADVAVVEKMTEALAHRGPDNGAVWANEKKSVVLGHRRLSVLGLESSANQPFLSFEKRYTLVYNGEIYNFKELQQELSEYEFSTHSDTEIIPAAFDKWGADCLNKFNGMFAFAIYDRKEDSLFLARDRFGIKPLYYYLDENQLLFSSEIRPLIHSGIFQPKINQQSLHSFIQFQTIPAPDTIIDSLQILMPGHCAIYKSENFTTKRWYKPAADFEPFSSLEAAQNSIKENLYQSVSRRTLSDVPLGAFLSGGIDSSAIVGILSETSEKKVDTFSVVFGEDDYSEAEYSRHIANRFHTNHHEISVSPKDFLEQIETALDDMDFPTVDGINSWVVSKATKNAGLTVALSGLGSDELFAGYSHFRRIHKLINHSNPLLAANFIGKNISNLFGKLKPGIAADKLNELTNLKDRHPANLYLLMRSIYNPSFANRFLGTNIENDKVVAQLKAELLNKKNFLMDDISLLEMNFYLPNILLRDTDQMSMAHALEVRVPFLDHQVVENVLHVEDKFKLTQQPKELLTDSLKGLLPKEITQRKKMGFLFPWDNWLRNDLKSFAERNINAFAQREYVSAAIVKSTWNEFLNGSKHLNWARVWCFVVLEHWLKKNEIE